MKAPRISVLMPALRPAAAHFERAIRSVLEQDFDDLELVIVEDPPEASQELVGQHVVEKFSDPRLRYEPNPVRTSLVRQRNRTLELARGELVAMLDADDLCEPSRLRKQWDLLERHPEVVVMGSQLTIIDDDGRKVGQRDYPTEHAEIRRVMRRSNPIPQPAVLARRSALLDAGGYTYDTYGGMAEDYELWCRLATAGKRLANHPDRLTRYRVHASATKATQLRNLLCASVDIKRTYFAAEMNAGDKLRLAAEQLMVSLPPSVVLWAFKQTTLRRQRG